MSPDLRVALGLWLNAYERAAQADRQSNDAVRVKELQRVIAELSDCCSRLHKVADTELEAEEATAATAIAVALASGTTVGGEKVKAVTEVRCYRTIGEHDEHPGSVKLQSTTVALANSYGTPPGLTLDKLVAALARWGETRSVVEDTERPTWEHYSDVELAEAELKRILSRCRRYAEAGEVLDDTF